MSRPMSKERAWTYFWSEVNSFLHSDADRPHDPHRQLLDEHIKVFADNANLTVEQIYSVGESFRDAYKIGLEDGRRPPSGTAPPNEVTECLQDVVSHHDDFVKACERMKQVAYTEGDALYWQHQINVLKRMKAQAETVVPARPTFRAPRSPITGTQG